MGGDKIFCLFIFISLAIFEGESYFKLNINLSSDNVNGRLDHFWRSTGFCPPQKHQDAADFDLSKDMQLNLAYIGAVPFHGIKQVRVHWLLDLVKVVRVSSQGPEYNFTLLDSFISLLASNGLAPGFELMGNPSNIFTDMENVTQVYWWRDLVVQMAKRYVGKYGILVVSKWNFETWNEPDCHDFDRLPMTVQGFLNYYDACSEGLKASDESLWLGGPADGCGQFQGNKFERKAVYAEALLHHVIYGKNFFTGETGIRLDFVSFHEKGEGQGIKVLEKEERLVNKLKSGYPKVAQKPFYNDEADPLVGWSKDEEWRANAVYPAVVAKVIAQHQNILLAQKNPPIPDYRLLSNDNGFLSYYPHQFTQRTLLARFQINNTNPHFVTFIRKEVYTVMTLLALLGDRQVHVDITKTGGLPVSNTSDYGVLASLHSPYKYDNSTSDSWQMAVLLYAASDPGNATDSAMVNMKWKISPPPEVKALKLCTYVLRNGLADPYEVWAGLYNKTSYPTLKQFQHIRLSEDPHPACYDTPVSAGHVVLPLFMLHDPQITLLHLCSMPTIPPEKVTGLQFIRVTEGRVLVIWSDENVHTKCLQTYEVERSSTGKDGPYTRVNSVNSIITLFMFETDIDECYVNNGGCEQRCINTGGSFHCSCDTGYTRNGLNCNDNDECAVSNGGCQQTCTNTIGSWNCSCDIGYNTNGQNCNDIDECAITNGGCKHICTNTIGSWNCSCNSGHAKNEQSCHDIDECRDNNGGCDQICTNSIGSWNCSCHSGYTKDGQSCHDIDECQARHGGCEQICTNTEGSWNCSCDAGYIINGQSCEDIDECKVNNGGCEQTCTNTVGSWKCSCGTGYTSIGLKCQDIDECQVRHGGCEQICTNTEGSWNCSCDAGYIINGESCEDVDECRVDNGGCVQMCSNTVGSRICSCNTGYTKNGKSCEDVDECGKNNGGCAQICTNQEGSWKCSCNSEFTKNGQNCDVVTSVNGDAQKSQSQIAGLHYGAFAGIIGGILVLIAIVTGSVLVMKRRRRRANIHSPSEGYQNAVYNSTTVQALEVNDVGNAVYDSTTVQALELNDVGNDILSDC